MNQIPEISKTIEIIFDKRSIILRSGSQIRTIKGKKAALAKAIIKLVNGTSSIQEIIEKIGPKFSMEEISNFLNQYSKLLFTFNISKSDFEQQAPVNQPVIGVIGDHPLGKMIEERISEYNQAIVHSYSGVRDLRASTGKEGLFICIPQNLTYGEIYEITNLIYSLKIPILFVTAEPQEIIIGPSFIPGSTACFECARMPLYFKVWNEENLNLFRKFSISGLGNGLPSTRMMIQAADKVLAESGRLLGVLKKGPLSYIQHLESIHLTKEGSHEFKINQGRNAECNICSQESQNGRLPEVVSQLAQEALIQISYSQRKGKPSSDIFIKDVDRNGQGINSIAIIGGGTAGYLSALALKKRFPSKEIVLIESKSVPIIGVGEATTPILLFFLYDVLGLDIKEIYAEVKPTWKLGIRFFWGLPGDYYFNHPFGIGDIFPSWYYQGSVNSSSLLSMMMSENVSPVIRNKFNGSHTSLIHKSPHAYHLDNELFVKYLQKKAAEWGIIHVEGTISEVNKNEGDDITSVILNDGREFSHDFYIDCSGFRSLLLEKSLKSKFISYGSSLFTDSAIVANVSNHGNIRPYTLADSMDHGWVWGIPLRDSDHRGYVYSSDFCDEESALKEMKAKFPDMGEHKTVKFRSGRHQEFWKNNVVAIGNSYGFVEPLESTGIHMIVQEILTIIDHFPKSKVDTGRRPFINSTMAAHWDFLKWFLAIHYKFNSKKDTTFWKYCRKETDISGVKGLIDIFKQEGPLSYHNDSIHSILAPFEDDIVFGPFGFDLMLLAQGVKPSSKIGILDDGKLWKDKTTLWKGLIEYALPQNEALRFLDGNPEYLQVD